MKVSVVLSSYNGEQYIEEQLNSLRKQTKKIDEVIISDDCSTDGTVDLIKNYISKYSLASWQLIENKVNSGWKINFKKSLQLASGDIIFPCDQDDIWHFDKIEKMTNAFIGDSKILLLASNYTPFYEGDAKKVHESTDLKNSKDLVQKADFKEKFFYISRPGCVYCFRKSLLKFFDVYSYEDYPHDAFLWRTAALLDGLYFYNKSLIDYRRHEGNATGREKKNISRKIYNTLYYEEVIRLAKKFLDNENVHNKDEKRIIIEKYSEWNSLRLQLLSKKNIICWIKLFRYRNCFYSTKTYFADLAMVLGIV